MKYLLIEVVVKEDLISPLLLRQDDEGKYWDITEFKGGFTCWTLILDNNYDYANSKRIIEPLPLEAFLEAWDGLDYTQECVEARRFLIEEI